MQIYTGLDLSRKRLDWQSLGADGTLVGAGAASPESDGLAHLVHRLGDAGVFCDWRSCRLWRNGDRDSGRARPGERVRQFAEVAAGDVRLDDVDRMFPRA